MVNRNNVVGFSQFYFLIHISLIEAFSQLASEFNDVCYFVVVLSHID